MGKSFDLAAELDSDEGVQLKRISAWESASKKMSHFRARDRAGARSRNRRSLFRGISVFKAALFSDCFGMTSSLKPSRIFFRRFPPHTIIMRRSGRNRAEFLLLAAIEHIQRAITRCGITGLFSNHDIKPQQMIVAKRHDQG